MKQSVAEKSMHFVMVGVSEMYNPPTQISREITFERADMLEEQWITPKSLRVLFLRSKEVTKMYIADY
jgi:chemotaxis methyl-accepting protein methylase